MIINLTKTENLPPELLRRFESLRDAIQNHDSFERLLENDNVMGTATLLNDFCMKNEIVGFHYTRADANSIKTHGLLSLTGDQRRAQFLKEHGHRFTSAQRQRIEDYWRSYFSPIMNRRRDGMIWFNFTHAALGNGGALPLLGHYGGETIYFPLVEDIEISSILKTIGQPAIVSCALNPATLITFSEIPWGKICLSSYCSTLNSKLDRVELDAYQKQSVEPEKIISITALRKEGKNFIL